MKNAELKTLDYFFSIPVHDLGYFIPISNAPVTLGLQKLIPQMAFTLELDLIRFEMWS